MSLFGIGVIIWLLNGLISILNMYDNGFIL